MRATAKLLSTMAALLGLAGCGSGFKSPAEELAYLESLSNPSPEQWKRREALKSGAYQAGRSETDGKRLAFAKEKAEELIGNAEADEKAGRDLGEVLKSYEAAVGASEFYPDSDFYKRATAGRDRVQRAIVNR